MATKIDPININRDRALFDRIAAKYALKDIIPSSARARRYQVLWAVAPVLEKLGSNINILELGCGVAASARYLAGRYQYYTGIDYSSEMIEAGRIFHQGNSRVRLRVDDVTTLPFLNGTADLVLAVGVLHHIPNIKVALESVRRVGRPGGWLVAIEPQRANPFIQLVRWLRGWFDSSYSREQRFFLKNELTGLLESAGFKNIKVEYQGYFSKPFGQVVLPFPRLLEPLSKLAVAIDKVLDQRLPRPLRFLAWDLVVWAQFPLESDECL